MMSTDGWLALVSGRFIAHHGLPQHDDWTVLAHGRHWADQQWLAQLALYSLQRIGDLWLLEAMQVACLVGAVVGAIFIARRRQAAELLVALVTLVSCLPLVATASAVRPQSFCYALWVVLIALLTSSGPLGWRRLGLALGILILWGNLHGSVLLAAALLSARGLTMLRHEKRSPTGWVALIAPWAAVFATPYASGLAHYYTRTAFNPTFGQYLAQWAPTAAQPVAIPIFALLIGGVWIYGRSPEALDRFEWFALALSALAGLAAVRNWPWFCLAAVALTPRGLPRAGIERRSVRDVASFLGLLFAVALPLSFFGLRAAQASLYPDGAATRVGALAGQTPHRTVWASTRFADWLLWRRPELAGSLVADARYELLTTDELERVVLFRFGGSVRWTEARAQVFVLDPDTDSRALDAIRPHVRVVYDRDHVVIAVTRRARN
jgi:hypothetical protein